MSSSRVILLGALTSALAVGCSTRDASSARDSSATAPAASVPAAGAAPAGDSIVRGNVLSIGDTTLTLGTAGGDVRVTLERPVQVYERRPADLSRVGEHSFVGVTSVSQPDGSQRATEIHLFPEALRGLGEGSRPMGQPGGEKSGGSPSTMTNGTVRSTMTNGTVAAPGASRMTNGAVRTQSAGTLTIEYRGGAQAIAVPAGVAVTEIVPTNDALTPGLNVVVVASKRPDGTLQSSRVLLATPPQRRP